MGRYGRGRGSVRGRGGGRGNRRSFSRNGGKGNKTSKTKKTITDIVFHVGSARDASEYETSMEFFINHVIEEKGHVLGQALKDETEANVASWEPNLQVSIATEDHIKAAENKQYEINYSKLYDEYLVKKRQYEEDKAKVYAMLWKRCSKTMQNKISALQDFEKTIYLDPIALKCSIKKHAQDYSRPYIP